MAICVQCSTKSLAEYIMDLKIKLAIEMLDFGVVFLSLTFSKSGDGECRTYKHAAYRCALLFWYLRPGRQLWCVRARAQKRGGL